MEAGGTRLEATGQAEPGVRPHVPPGSAVAGGSPGPPAPLLTTLRGSAEELHAIGKEEDEMQLEERGQVASVAQSDEPAGLEPTRARFTAVLANLYTCGTSALHALKYNSLRSLSEYIHGNSTAPLSRPLWLLGVNYDLTGMLDKRCRSLRTSLGCAPPSSQGGLRAPFVALRRDGRRGASEQGRLRPLQGGLVLPDLDHI